MKKFFFFFLFLVFAVPLVLAELAENPTVVVAEKNSYIIGSPYPVIDAAGVPIVLSDDGNSFLTINVPDGNAEGFLAYISPVGSQEIKSASSPTGRFVERVVTEPGSEGAKYGLLGIALLALVLFIVVARAGISTNAKVGLILAIVLLAAVSIPFIASKGQPTSYVVHEFEPEGIEPQYDGIAIPGAIAFTFPQGPVYTIFLPEEAPPAGCGNGVLEGGEACDDGNNIDCDGCKGDCSRQDNICGDGIVECGEECDDGNTNNGDGCSSTCEIEELLCKTEHDPDNIATIQNTFICVGLTSDCNDGIDNDGDGYADYGSDPQCGEQTDNELPCRCSASAPCEPSIPLVMQQLAQLVLGQPVTCLT